VSKQRKRIGYVIGTYPLLTTRFVDREIRAVRDLGADVEIVSLRQPSSDLSADQLELASDVSYVMGMGPLQLARALTRFAWRPAFLQLAIGLLSASHSGWRSRAKTVLHLGQGLAAAQLFADTSIDHVHAHFVDRAAVVGMVVATLMGIEYSATAHANDIYVSPVLLEEKVNRATFVSTCTRFNQAYLIESLGDVARQKVVVNYHGLDTAPYLTAERDVGDKLRIVAIGQLKEKKGFTYLVEAIALLSHEGLHDVRLEIVGSGPLKEDLQAQVVDRGLSDRVQFTGSLTHPEVIQRLRAATMFVMSSVLADDGDRDGIPNVILEAMACEVPVIGTSVSGIPEVVHDGKTGLLVAPNDARALADSIRRLAEDPGLRVALSTAARQIVVDSFDTERNAKQLLDRFAGGGDV
jgi:colanic acid/amylovoran biosynthesis glycosyltransferase